MKTAGICPPLLFYPRPLWESGFSVGREPVRANNMKMTQKSVRICCHWNVLLARIIQDREQLCLSCAKTTNAGEGICPLGIIVMQNQKQKTSGGHSLSQQERVRVRQRHQIFQSISTQKFPYGQAPSLPSLSLT